MSWSVRLTRELSFLIDLHSHILPGIDDGSPDLETSIEMAQIAVADGVRILACTPHINPPVYANTVPDIRRRTADLQAEFDRRGISLRLVPGADVHISIDLLAMLRSQSSPRLNGSRYFLFEPPHKVLPPNLEAFSKSLLAAGYVPILTHPERLTWIEQSYDVMCRLDEMGLCIQLTAASITGQFGKRAQYWSERMLDEGRVDIIASDAHGSRGRTPKLSAARDLIADRLGPESAQLMTLGNPSRILKNERLVPKKRVPTQTKAPKAEVWTRFFGKRRSDPGR